jgi:sugar-specific transcriptional regulator TrmB
MNRKELEEMLKELDLTDYEAKAYSALVFLGGHSKASEIAKLSKIPQPKIYETLEKLTEKKLVETYAIRPKEFKVISPKIVLKNLIEEKEKKIMKMKNKIEEIAISFRPKFDAEVLEGIWTSSEKSWKDFIDRLSDMFDRSQEYVYVMSKNFSWSSKLGKSVKAAKKRGVNIRTISIGEIDENKYYRAKWFHDNGVEIRILKTKVHPSLINMDGKEVLLRLDKDPIKRERFVFTSIWSKDASFVKVIDSYVKNIWKIAKPVDFEKIPKPKI